MQTYFRWLFVVIAWCSFDLHASNPPEVLVGPAEDWVIERNVVRPEAVPEDDIGNGVHYLLSDKQILVDGENASKYFQRYTEMIVNQKGLEYSSQIQVQFDPVYQSLKFHQLRIIRDDRIIEKLGSVNFKLLQRENELESLIYNGRLTASVILDDVRVGDIIDYSYTIEGDNPIYDGIFSSAVSTQWQVPLERQFFRLLWKKQEALYINALNTDIAVSETQLQDAVEYAFSAEDSKPLITNSESPSWFSPYGKIFFSESERWSDVVDWALPMYRTALSDREGVESIANTIKESTQDKNQQIVEALRYVQDEIRYMGIETGANSHRPSAAKETIERRYGDCKDKAVLYIAILDELDVQAYPALVNTYVTKQLADFPPYVNAFDHVIVLVENEGKAFWFDPTRQYQYGNMDEISQPDFGFALVIKPGASELTEMDFSSTESRLVVHDVFDLSKGAGNDVTYTSKSEYFGYRAERLRNQIAEYGLSDIETDFTDFYQAYYPEIERVGKIRIDSKPERDRLTVHEEFRINNFWEENSKTNKYLAEFYANLISAEIAKPDQLNRNSPYSLTYPNNIWQSIEVKLSEKKWRFEDERSVEDNPFFHFEYSSSYDENDHILLLKYHLKTKGDHVPVDGMQAYLAARDRMLEHTEYNIFDYIDPTAASTQENDGDDIEALVAASLFVGYLLAIIFALVSWRRDSRRGETFDDAVFYPVSLLKLWMFSVVTFGIYTAYWFYRNWIYVKEKEHSSIMPVARGIFSYFWYYPLYKKLKEDQATRNPGQELPNKALYLVLAIAYFLANMLGNLDYIGMPLLLLTPLMVIPLANRINHINQANEKLFARNSQWKLRHSLLALFFIPAVFFIYAGEVNLLPSSKVVDGRLVWKHDLKFMHRNGIVPADEEIIMFYSDAFLSIREDGNGFTDTQVFSYWAGDDGALEIRRAELEDVEDIETRFATEWGDNTTFGIRKKDGSEFVLYASIEERRDRIFDQRLRKQWLLAKQTE
jgi:transglutaminase-like putative cysteine protease